MNVAVIGASSKPERTSYLAMQRLPEAGHKVFPVHPSEKEIFPVELVIRKSIAGKHKKFKDLEKILC